MFEEKRLNERERGCGGCFFGFVLSEGLLLLKWNYKQNHNLLSFFFVQNPVTTPLPPVVFPHGRTIVSVGPYVAKKLLL